MPFANMKVPAGILSTEQKKHAVDAITDLYVEFYASRPGPTSWSWSTRSWTAAGASAARS
jgi:phenylpyruvate tautomerase PptA (4-oxalocrotonate tautomerase family)